MTEKELKELRSQIKRIQKVYKENHSVFLEDGNISADEKQKLKKIENRLREVVAAYKTELKKFQERGNIEKMQDFLIDNTDTLVGEIGDGLEVVGEVIYSAGMTTVITADALLTKTGDKILETVSSLGETIETAGETIGNAGGSIEPVEETIKEFGETIASIGQTIKDVKPEENGNVVDSSVDGVIHYFEGEGDTVELGAATKEAIKKSKDMLHYIHRITTGLTTSPAEGHGLPIDLTFEGKNVFHVGRTVVSYQTICKNNTCITTFTVAEKDGFWDPVYDSDGNGPGGELPGGTTYKYKPFSWDITFDNPGYNVDKNKRPVLMLLPPE